MEIEDVHNVLGWANCVADKYNRGIAGIVDAFINANNTLHDIEKAKKFVEDEMSAIKN